MSTIYDSFDHIKEINKAMQRAIDPMYDINKSLNFATSITDRATASLKAIQPYEDINKIMESITVPFGSYKKMIEDLNPMKKLNEETTSMLDPFKKIQEQMDSLYTISDFSFQNSTIKAAEQLQDSLNITFSTTSLQKYNDLVSSQMESYKKMAKALSSISSSVVHNPFRSVDNVIEKILERETAIQKVTQNTTPAEALTEFTSAKDEIAASLDSRHLKIEEQLEKISILIESLKNPWLLAFFVSVIFPIIINNISNTIYDTAVKPAISAYTNTKAQQIHFKKEVIYNAKSILNTADIVTKYRIVTADVLNVRTSNSTKSKVIAYAFFGEVVEIVNKKRNWCLIKRYDSENDTYVQGWVFTRYLGRIR